jgi:hypothetical protein
LGGHGKKQRVLPALGVIQAARAREPPVNSCGEILVVFGRLQTHSNIIPLGQFAVKQACGAWPVTRPTKGSTYFPVFRPRRDYSEPVKA